MTLGLGLATAVLAGPVAADPCRDLWAAVTRDMPFVTAPRVIAEGGRCVHSDVVRDWHVDLRRIGGGAVPWRASRLVTGAGFLSDALGVEVEGQRPVVQIGDPLSHHLFAAGRDALALSGAVRGVDLSSVGAM